MLRVYSLVETIQGLKEAIEHQRVKEGEIKLYLDMLRCEQELASSFSFPGADSKDIAERWEKNLPALDNSYQICNLPTVHNLFRSLANILLGYLPNYKDDVQEVLSKDISYFARGLSKEETFDSQIIYFLFAHAVHPFLVKASQAIVETGPNLKKWTKGFCPLCGARPDIASLDKDAGSRKLLCSQCDCEWPYRRIGCPFCENRDFNKIFYYTDETGRYRLYMCEECGEYLKTVDLRELAVPLALSVERYLSQGLDAAVKQVKS